MEGRRLFNFSGRVDKIRRDKIGLLPYHLGAFYLGDGVAFTSVCVSWNLHVFHQAAMRLLNHPTRRALDETTTRIYMYFLFNISTPFGPPFFYGIEGDLGFQSNQSIALKTFHVFFGRFRSLFCYEV